MHKSAYVEHVFESANNVNIAELTSRLLLIKKSLLIESKFDNEDFIYTITLGTCRWLIVETSFDGEINRVRLRYCTELDEDIPNTVKQEHFTEINKIIKILKETGLYLVEINLGYRVQY